MVFRQILSIRGNPSRVYSDSGSQLLVANLKLKKIIAPSDKTKLHELGAEKSFEWQFSSPHAQWQNGCS